MAQAVTKPDAKIRVAAADTEPAYLRELRHILSSQPDLMLIAAVSRADQVSQMLRRHRPDILLLEMGLALAAESTIGREVRAGHWPHSRIIILTSSDDERDSVRAIQCGAVGVLQKNCESETLLRCIRRVHGGEAWVDAQTTAAVVRAFQSSEPQSSAIRDDGLSKREREVIELVARGFRNAEIAEKLSLRHGTIKQHLHNIYTKLGLESRTGLAVYAVQQGWLSYKSIAPTADDEALPPSGSAEREDDPSDGGIE